MSYYLKNYTAYFSPPKQTYSVKPAPDNCSYIYIFRAAFYDDNVAYARVGIWCTLGWNMVHTRFEICYTVGETMVYAMVGIDARQESEYGTS
jgi:hypothetical protein